MTAAVMWTAVWVVSLCLVVIHRPALAVSSLLAEPSCVDDLKLRCANAAALSELDVLECVQLYEVK